MAFLGSLIWSLQYTGTLMPLFLTPYSGAKTGLFGRCHCAVSHIYSGSRPSEETCLLKISYNLALSASKNSSVVSLHDFPVAHGCDRSMHAAL